MRGAAFVGAVLLLGARVVPRLMGYVERLGSAELFLLTAVALALGTATVSAQLGLSPALGAFLGGLLLAETEFDHRVIAEIIPMRNLFATLFFVSIGMLIDPSFIVANAWSVVGVGVFIVLAKALVTLVAVLPFRLGGRTAMYTATGMIPIGEFSYVLAQGGREIGAVPDWLYSTILSSSVLTVLLTPAAFWAAPKLHSLLSRVPGTGRTFGAHPQMLLDDAPMDGHALVVGYGRVGHHVGEGLRAAGLAVVAIDADLSVVHALAGAGGSCHLWRRSLFECAGGRSSGGRAVDCGSTARSGDHADCRSARAPRQRKRGTPGSRLDRRRGPAYAAWSHGRRGP